MITLTFTGGISCQHLPENTDVSSFENFIFSFSCKRYCLNPQPFFFSNAYKVVIVDLLFGNLLSQSIILLLKAVKEFDQLL